MRSRVLGFSLVLLLLPALAAARAVDVTNTNDAGAGSFRAALEVANAGECGADCRIVFRIPGPVPESGWFTIRLRSLLPQLTVRRVSIDGTTQTELTGNTNPFGPEIEIDGSAAGHGPGLKFVDSSLSEVAGLAINRFSGNGVVLERSGVQVRGNYIGTDPTGTVARPNGLNGVLSIGSTGAGIWFNVISGNAGNGVYIHNSNVDVRGNHIGAGRTTAFVLPNGANGVHLGTYVSEVSGNVITFNRDHGITLGANAGMIRIQANEVWGNGFLSIDLGHDGVDVADPLDADRGANGKMNAPVLTSARGAIVDGRLVIRIRGTISTVPRHAVDINLYAAPHRSRLGLGETRIPLTGTEVVTDANGFAQFDVEIAGLFENTPFIPGGFIVGTAFAPGAREGTSELSVPIAFEALPQIEVTTTADAGPGSLRAAIEASNAATCTADAPCRITFHVAAEELIDGVAVIEPATPLPALTREHVIVDGSTQTWWTGRSTSDGPVVAIHGTQAGDRSNGLRIGSADAPIAYVGVRDVAITDFGGDGVVVHQKRVRDGGVLLTNLSVESNGGNGLVLFGGSGTEYWNQGYYGTTVAGLVARDNRGHGVLVEDDANALRDVQVIGNAGHGIFVRGSSCRVTGGTIAMNGGDGFATSSNARAVYVEAFIFANAGLGIDRNDDGVTANDFTENDGVLDAPELLSARWDEPSGTTIVRGRLTQRVPALPQRQASSNSVVRLRFFRSADPDPSGFGEGERSVRPHLDIWVPLEFTGEFFEARLDADLRGQWLTATRLMKLCYWELGCGEAETSEFSNAVKGE